MNKKERKIVDELISMSSFYNFWDIDSMRMSLGNIKETLKKLKKVLGLYILDIIILYQRQR